MVVPHRRDEELNELWQALRSLLREECEECEDDPTPGRLDEVASYLAELMRNLHSDGWAAAELRHATVLGRLDDNHRSAGEQVRQLHSDQWHLLEGRTREILDRLQRVEATARLAGGCPPAPAPRIQGRVPSATDDDRRAWFEAHASGVPEEIVHFLDGCGVALSGREVVDVGCGDGIIDLGLCLETGPARLLGFDIVPTDVEELSRLARRYRSLERLPEALSFATCTDATLPLADGTVDAVVSWSTFEHVSKPAAVMAEIRRVLRPGGFVFLQVWPLYYSPHGSHLWHWFPDGYDHFTNPPDVLIDRIAQDAEMDEGVKHQMLIDFQTLNHVTVDELDDHLRAAGLRTVRAELLTGPTNLPAGLPPHRLVDLLVAGIKLVAVPDG